MGWQTYSLKFNRIFIFKNSFIYCSCLKLFLMENFADAIEPTSLGELQLYKVLERANLLGYFEIFISQGGDDVQQLCEAGEEEFLEIMSLIGMASKPLHVRRFQKALQEWVTSPHLFQLHSDSPRNAAKPADIGLQTLQRNATNSTNLQESKFLDLSSNDLNQHGFLLQEKHTRPQSLPNIHYKERLHTDKGLNLSLKNQQSDSLNYDKAKEYEESLDKITISLLTKFAGEEIEQRFPQKLSFDEAVEQIKNGKKHPHLIRVLEMGNTINRGKELRRHSNLFPIHCTDRFLNLPLSNFELMCNEASLMLCQQHPPLLVAGRSERLNIAESVVKKVKQHLKQLSTKLPDTNDGQSLCKGDEIKNKLNKIKVQQEAFTKKIAEAKQSKNYITSLEYQSELRRLKQEEQILLEENKQILSENSIICGSSSKNSLDICDKNRDSVDELKLQSSTLAELARAHNVFDDSQSDVISSTKQAEFDESHDQHTSNHITSDLLVKKEMIDGGFPSVEHASGTSPHNHAMKRPATDCDVIQAKLAKHDTDA